MKINFDFSTEQILHPNGSNITPFVYKDIGTANIRYYEDPITEQAHIDDRGSSNIDANAIKASLTNILNFRNGERILDPEFGIGQVYQMLYTPFDKHTTQKMIQIIKNVISRYEPRIDVIEIPTSYNEDKLEYTMTIKYYIPSLQMNDAFKFSMSQNS